MFGSERVQAAIRLTVRLILDLQWALLRLVYVARLRRDPPLRNHMTIVAPVYNVAKYLDQMLDSIVHQSTGLRNLEVILVDDGSTDGSDKIAARWAKRYPQTIKLLRQPQNAGVAAARNRGIEAATGDWISFVDTDDTLAFGCLHHIDDEISRDHARPLLMVIPQLIIHREASGARRATSSLARQFQKQRTEVPTDSMDGLFQLSASAWMRREALVRHAIRFRPDIRPTFEDGFFVNELLLREPGDSAVFLRDAHYLYRRRIAEDSAINRSRQSAAWFVDQLQTGYLALLALAQETRDFVPPFIQALLIQELYWRLLRARDRPDDVKFLSPEQRASFVARAREILTHIDPGQIEYGSAPFIAHEYRVGLLAVGKSADPLSPLLFVVKADKEQIQFRYVSRHPENNVVLTVNSDAAPLLHPSRSRTDLFGEVFFYEHYFWVAIPSDATIVASVGGRTATIRKDDAPLKGAVTGAVLRAAFTKPQQNPFEMKPRWLVQQLALARRGKDPLWLFMDRVDRADDNAEHFYRHIVTRRPDAEFVLSRNSVDWERLRAEGFNLVAYGSLAHYVALANATLLVSSHADRTVFWPFPRYLLSNLTRYRFVFLQHGVIKDDLSQWLNQVGIDLFVTSTEEEYQSIASPQSNYIYSGKEVRLTGLPRHDRLLELGKAATPGKLLIMPTWRKYLSPSLMGIKSSVVSGFEASEFARNWKALLLSADLHALADDTGKQIVFVMHPNMTPYADFFRTEGVSVADAKSALFQPLLADAAVCITDFSSIVFDAACLNRPVVYFQFDNDVFAESHVYTKGYFDYGLKGFGPVCATVPDVVLATRAALTGAEPPVYERRRIETIAYRDGKNCERVLRAVEELVSR
jgi:glycosyltransferase involved in cell wall biosynthesis